MHISVFLSMHLGSLFSFKHVYSNPTWLDHRYQKRKTQKNTSTPYSVLAATSLSLHSSTGGLMQRSESSHHILSIPAANVSLWLVRSL